MFQDCQNQKKGYDTIWVIINRLTKFVHFRAQEFQQTCKAIVKIRERIKVAQCRQKSYANNRKRNLEFKVGNKVFLKAEKLQNTSEVPCQPYNKQMML